MPDSVYLSLWLRDFSEPSMLAAWAVALAEFPVSSLAPNIRKVSVYPFNWGEAPVMEQAFDDPGEAEPPELPSSAVHAMEVAQVAAIAAEFLHEDYAYEAELNWDVWCGWEGTALDQWERRPMPVTISCLGPAFEREDGQESGNLLINFGPESVLFPDENPAADSEELLEGVAGSCYRDNIEQMLAYVHRIEARLPVTRRLLWSASGEDLAERIRAAWE